MMLKIIILYIILQ